MMQSSCSSYPCQSPLLIWCVIAISVYKLGRDCVKALAQNEQHVAGYAGFPKWHKYHILRNTNSFTCNDNTPKWTYLQRL